MFTLFVSFFLRCRYCDCNSGNYQKASHNNKRKDHIDLTTFTYQVCREATHNSTRFKMHCEPNKAKKKKTYGPMYKTRKLYDFHYTKCHSNRFNKKKQIKRFELHYPKQFEFTVFIDTIQLVLRPLNDSQTLRLQLNQLNRTSFNQTL